MCENIPVSVAYCYKSLAFTQNLHLMSVTLYTYLLEFETKQTYHYK